MAQTFEHYRNLAKHGRKTLNDIQQFAVRSLLNAGKTPLEAAKELDIHFHIVRAFCECNGLEPRKYFVAMGVRKAVQEDAYWPPEC